MRFIHLFLAGYFVVILGIGLGLWQTGVFSRVAPIWVGIGALVAIGVGIMLAVSSGEANSHRTTGEMTRSRRYLLASPFPQMHSADRVDRPYSNLVQPGEQA